MGHPPHPPPLKITTRAAPYTAVSDHASSVRPGQGARTDIGIHLVAERRDWRTVLVSD